MNKNIVIIVGFILVGIITYQAYLLGKNSTSPLLQAKKEQPEISIDIEKKSVEKEIKELNKPLTQTSQTKFNPDEMFDEKLIKEDLNRLFKNIFGNPKLQEEIRDGLKEAEVQLQEGIKEMEKGFGDLSLELEKLSKDDPFFKDLFNTLTDKNRLKFTDRGEDYYLSLKVDGGANSKIDIKAKDGFLTISVLENIEKTEQKNNTTLHTKSVKEHTNTIFIPSDAVIDKLKTEYKNSTLEVVISKR